MKKKQREPWTNYWELYAEAIFLFIAFIGFCVFTFMYLAGRLGF